MNSYINSLIQSNDFLTKVWLADMVNKGVMSLSPRISTRLFWSRFILCSNPSHSSRAKRTVNDFKRLGRAVHIPRLLCKCPGLPGSTAADISEAPPSVLSSYNRIYHWREKRTVWLHMTDRVRESQAGKRVNK